MAASAGNATVIASAELVLRGEGETAAGQFHDAAQVLRETARQTMVERRELAEWDDGLLTSGITGSALVAGIARLSGMLPVWDNTANQMFEAAGVLDLASSLQEFLDGQVERLKNLALWMLPTTREAPIAAWFIARLSQVAGALGDAIDAHCAAAVTAICTPQAAPPTRPFELAEGEDLAAIHEYNLLAHPEYLDLVTQEHVTLLEASRDGVAVCIGDLDNADNVVTFVAGVGSSDQQRWPKQIANARSIHQASGTPTVAWLGYRAPDGLGKALAKDPARAAGKGLQGFQRALSARNPKQRKIVVGYSYGSVVAGHAAAEGLDADELVLVGSPGVPLEHASQARLSGDGGVHALISPHDLIDWPADGRGGVHGVDPSSASFGARRWPAGHGGHGSYFSDPQTLGAITKVIRGVPVDGESSPPSPTSG